MNNRKERITDSLVLFWGGIYSNWFKRSFNYGNVTYSSCEQFLMHRKALLFGDDVTAVKIMNTHNVSKIKKLGREVQGYDDAIWSNQRLGIAVRGIYEKFSQHEDLKQQMLNDFQFGFRSFVEASPKDELWGVFLGQNDDRVLDVHNWQGTNLLGTALDLVATRLLIESGHNLRELPLNVGILLQYIPLACRLHSKAKKLSIVTNVCMKANGSTFMSADDWLNGGDVMYKTIRHFLGYRKFNETVDFSKFRPWEHNLEECIFPNP
ncbi:NADAR family protein [Vibrio owensii]|uniref:NADAR family protein n=1 Tax=Vibrio owensii TaxID=696485 RepID=UPI0003710F52|nr:NADAR family protein [Vibrio owensii]